jgi:hypothetical protein
MSQDRRFHDATERPREGEDARELAVFRLNDLRRDPRFEALVRKITGGK